MPKLSRCGVRNAEKTHWLQVHWTGSYGGGAYLQDLDRTDIETVGARNQIQIKNGSALIRAPERCTGVTVDVYLPPQVRTLIVHKFAMTETYCFFKNAGRTAYPGEDLRNDPFFL